MCRDVLQKNWPLERFGHAQEDVPPGCFGACVAKETHLDHGVCACADVFRMCDPAGASQWPRLLSVQNSE